MKSRTLELIFATLVISNYHQSGLCIRPTLYPRLESPHNRCYRGYHEMFRSSVPSQIYQYKHLHSTLWFKAVCRLYRFGLFICISVSFVVAMRLGSPVFFPIHSGLPQFKVEVPQDKPSSSNSYPEKAPIMFELNYGDFLSYNLTVGRHKVDENSLWLMWTCLLVGDNYLRSS